MTYARRNAFSFSATTGAVRSWNPSPDAGVESIALAPSCTTAYLGGFFTHVGASAASGIAAVSATSGAILPGFAHRATGAVRTVALVRSATQLVVGGNFTAINGSTRPYLASLDPSTGTVSSYLRAAVAGQLPPNAGSTMIYNQQVSAQGDRLLVEGNFLTIGGQPRHQLAELDLGPTAATVDPWSNATLNSTQCSVDEQFYGRAAAFSPDGQTIYLASTGEEGTSPFCSALTAFTNTAPATVKWINKTGRDSLYAVAAGTYDVYIGGHERWADNPDGADSCGSSGCVPRPGVGDIAARTGLATSWNPTRDRGHGADHLLITPAGLWVASDTFFGAVKCDGVYHPGICFFPGTA